MTPTEAIEFVRHKCFVDTSETASLRDAVDTLSNLVERAGEPVACDAIPAHEWETLSVEASEYDSSLEHAWKRCVRCGTRVHVTRDTLPPTAPGASHER